jgi:formate dehydrogenase subunit gamma
MGGTAIQTDAIREIVRPHVGQVGGLISALRAVQARFGFLPPGTDAIAADEFNLSQAEVKGVASFYADFRQKPAGRVTIRLCAAEACQAQDGRRLEADICRRFAIRPGQTSASGDLTLEHVYCLGLCSAGPAAMVGVQLIARASDEKIAAAFDREAEAQE